MKHLTPERLATLRAKAQSRDITYTEIDELIAYLDITLGQKRVEFAHGNGGYVHHGCRCNVCTDGRREYQLKRRARKLLDEPNENAG